MTAAVRVLDPGPIPYSDIDLFGDPDLEHALREGGLDPAQTTYQLIEIPITSITDTASMPWPRMGTAYVDALKAGETFPPIVVVRNQRGWSLLDGVNRTHAHWTLGTATLRAYDLLSHRQRAPVDQDPWVLTGRCLAAQAPSTQARCTWVHSASGPAA